MLNGCKHISSVFFLMQAHGFFQPESFHALMIVASDLVQGVIEHTWPSQFVDQLI